MSKTNEIFAKLVADGVLAVTKNDEVINTNTGNILGKNKAGRRHAMIGFKIVVDGKLRQISTAKHRVLWLIRYGSLPPDNMVIVPVDNNYENTDQNNHKLQKRSVYNVHLAKLNGSYCKNMRRASKLNLEIVSQCRYDYKNGIKSNPKLAREYNVSPNTMYKAIHGLTWPDAKEPPVIGRPDCQRRPKKDAKAKAEQKAASARRRRARDRQNKPPELHIVKFKPKEPVVIVKKPNVPKPERVVIDSETISDFNKELQTIELLKKRGVEPEQIVETLLDRKTRMPVSEILKHAKAA